MAHSSGAQSPGKGAHDVSSRLQPCGYPIKVSKGAKIRNRYNQVPHLTQDTNGKLTVRHHKREPRVQPFSAGDHKPPDTTTISERPSPDTICQNFHLPEVILPRHHQNVEQPSPDSSKLLDTRHLQGGSTTRQTPLDSY